MAIQDHQHDETRKAALMSPLLDEVFALRALCALQSVALNDLLPPRAPAYQKHRAEKIRGRLEQGARGEAKQAIAGTATARALSFVGAAETFTRADFEDELGWPHVEPQEKLG